MNDIGNAPHARDLYLMQAECGLIKIGRAANTKRRVKQISSLARERIAIVYVLEGRGESERRIQAELEQHRFLNEWFSGSKACREAISKLLGVAVSDWPFRWNRSAADRLGDWLEAMAKLQHLIKQRSLISSGLRKGFSGPVTNAEIWMSLSPGGYSFAPCERPVTVTRHTDPRVGPIVPPNYIGDAAIARTIGPPGWLGPPPETSATEIVVAALTARTRHERDILLAKYG